jgi:hypothetical protein
VKRVCLVIDYVPALPHEFPESLVCTHRIKRYPQRLKLQFGFLRIKEILSVIAKPRNISILSGSDGAGFNKKVGKTFPYLSNGQYGEKATFAGREDDFVSRN